MIKINVKDDTPYDVDLSSPSLVDGQRSYETKKVKGKGKSFKAMYKFESTKNVLNGELSKSNNKKDKFD